MLDVSRFDRVIGRPGRRGLYESHYLKANAPGEAGALWIKYCLLLPTAELPPAAELWAVVWDGPGRQPVVVKESLPLDGFRFGESALAFDGPNVHLDAAHATGKLASAGHTIAWDLTLESPEPALAHYHHARLYDGGFPKKKIITPVPRARLRGWIEVDGRRIDLGGWTGFRGHNWGSEHAYAYAYGNCNRWDDPSEDLVLDGFTARIRLGKRFLSPWLSAAVGRRAGRDLEWNRPLGWLARGSSVDFPRWRLRLSQGGSRLEADWEANPADLAGLRYFHPDGRVSYCYNTKYARLDVRLTESDGRQARLSSRAAELEFLYPEPVPGIPLHGNIGFPR